MTREQRDGTAIVSLSAHPDPAAAIPAIEDIFFEASGRTFAPGPERDAFRERWLGRYLDTPGDVVLLAYADDGVLAGYLVGALSDPAGQDRFADIGYFRGAFREQTRAFPAHLHINLTPAWRGRGVGARLIDTFGAIAHRHGAPGMHVVTGKGLRNVGFYTRCGFREEGVTSWNGKDVVFLGRRLP